MPTREGWVLFDQSKDEWMLGRRNSRVQDGHLQKGRGWLGVGRGHPGERSPWSPQGQDTRCKICWA